MKPLSLAARADCFKAAFPQYPEAVPRTSDRWLDAVWILGNTYKSVTPGPDGKPMYGSYPPGLVARIISMFPDAEDTLHLFSGALPPGPYTRFDCRSELFQGVQERLPGTGRGDSVVGDAEALPDYFPPGTFDFVMADPPYSPLDAAKYSTAMPDRRKVLRGLHAVVRPGGHLVWVDTCLPQFRKDMWRWWGNLCIIRSTNHRVRLASLFQRV